MPEWHYVVPRRSGRKASLYASNFPRQLLPLPRLWLVSASDSGAIQLGDRSLTGHAVHIPRAPLSRLSAASPAWQSGPSPLAATLDPADEPGDRRRDPALAKTRWKHDAATLQRSVAADALCISVCATEAQPSAGSLVVVYIAVKALLSHGHVCWKVYSRTRGWRGDLQCRLQCRRGQKNEASEKLLAVRPAIQWSYLPSTHLLRVNPGSPMLHKEHRSYPGVPSITVSNQVLQRRRITASHGMCRCWSNPSPGHHQAQFAPSSPASSPPISLTELTSVIPLHTLINLPPSNLCTGCQFFTCCHHFAVILIYTQFISSLHHLHLPYISGLRNSGSINLPGLIS